MAKATKKEKREPDRMPADVEPSPAKRAAAPPPGYLPTADPPRQNVLLLTIAALLLALWMLVLSYLALWG